MRNLPDTLTLVLILCALLAGCAHFPKVKPDTVFTAAETLLVVAGDEVSTQYEDKRLTLGECTDSCARPYVSAAFAVDAAWSVVQIARESRRKDLPVASEHALQAVDAVVAILAANEIGGSRLHKAVSTWRVFRGMQ